MYEQSRTQFHPGEGDSASAGSLRAIAWPELVARLSAQSDLRRVLLDRNAGGSASFNGGAAAWLSRSEAPAETSKRDVNRDALSDSNQAGAIDADAACGAVEGDREIL